MKELRLTDFKILNLGLTFDIYYTYILLSIVGFITGKNYKIRFMNEFVDMNGNTCVNRVGCLAMTTRSSFHKARPRQYFFTSMEQIITSLSH